MNRFHLHHLHPDQAGRVAPGGTGEDEMERYNEKKRERRRRDLERIVERTAARIRRW